MFFKKAAQEIFGLRYIKNLSRRDLSHSVEWKVNSKSLSSLINFLISDKIPFFVDDSRSLDRDHAKVVSQN